MEGAQAEASIRLVRESLGTPKVLVVASADATALCQKNGLTFTQLMRPFGRVPRKGTPVFFQEKVRSPPEHSGSGDGQEPASSVWHLRRVCG
jgi:hypothetical protein